MANEPNSTQGTGADPQSQNNNQNDGNTGNAGEKKYSEEEMNGISKKNSEKAVKKFMKELGITDVDKAKEILAKAAQGGDGGTQQGAGGDDAASLKNLSTQLSQANERANRAAVENILLKNHVKTDKVEKAARLVDLSECLDEDGAFSAEKADSAVKELLKDWDELVEKKAEGNTGFQIGSDGQTGSGNSGAGNKAVPRHRWNKFNY